MAAKKNKEEDKEPVVIVKEKAGPPPAEGLPLWMATYSDMVTLLLTFFVLLLTFANMDAEKFKASMGSIQKALGIQTKDVMALEVPYSSVKYERKDIELTKKERKILDLMLGVKALIEEELENDQSTTVSHDPDGVMQRVDGEAMFAPGSATLKPQSKRLLDVVAKVMKKTNVNLIISGHTDDRPLKSAKFPSNWELSAARAAAALRYLTEVQHIDPGRMKAVGYAGTRPLVPNDSEQNRERNNRVDFHYQRPDLGNW
ncbi:OmpA/MotB family protein [Desulfovibrio inopinatus]|uniref:OmpA/MotB family protein n=1 Tax=Desulfovibrio inopinatus TaxID=102109 RepID=UPI00040A4A9C|nr:OmpA family protein [Desulfovibrio inopinatus]